MQLALFELSNVLIISHAAIDDHGGTFLKPGALGQTIEHGGECGMIAGIASEHLVSDREPIAVDHQPHHHLFAIGALVARMAELGLVVARALTLKIC